MAIDYVSTSYPKNGTFADNTLYVNPSAKEVRVGETIIGKNYDDRCTKIENSILSEAKTRENAITNIEDNAVHNNQYYIRYVPIVGASNRNANSTPPKYGCTTTRKYYDTEGKKFVDSNSKTSNTCRALEFSSDKDYVEIFIPLDGPNTHMDMIKDNEEDTAIGILGVNLYNVSFKGILSSFSIENRQDPEALGNPSRNFIRLIFIFCNESEVEKSSRRIIDSGIVMKNGEEKYIQLRKGSAYDLIGYKSFKDRFNGSYVKVLFKRNESDWEKLNG